MRLPVGQESLLPVVVARMYTLTSLDAVLLRPGVFSQPIRMALPPSWVSHIPFAFWVVDALKPSVFVELGTHSGNSYAAFAQAVQSLELGTACYAVDTWAGDPQAGFYDESIYEEWSAFHDRHFGGFSRLVRSTFDDARPMFGDRAIDLLHIDGLHTYDAIRHDFESWLPKLSARGVVLLHDINVRQGDFGAWRFWEELAGRYPTFAFLHGHGLGVVAVGTDLPADLRWLVSDLVKQPREHSVVQRFFARLGTSLEREWQLNASSNAQRQLTHRIGELQTEAQRHAEERDALAALVEQLRAASAQETDQVRAALLDEAARRAAAEVRVDTEVQHHAEDFGRLRDALEQMAREADDRTVEVDRLAAAERRLSAERDGLRAAVEELEHERATADCQATALRVSAASAVREQRNLNRGLTAARDELERMRTRPMWRMTSALRRLGPLGLRPLLKVRGPASAAPVIRMLAKPRRLMESRRVVLSGLFDERYYLSRYDDVRRSGAPAAAHYVMAGAREGRAPHPLFDAEWYLARHADVRESGMNPLVHYVQTGARERRDPHPLFSTVHYLAQHPDIELLETNPLLHFLSAGPGDDTSPHPLFDSTFYAQHNPDVVAAKANAFVHFVEHGGVQGRAPHALFDAAFYLRRNPDVRSAGVNPLLHYLEHVPGEDRDPHPLFDTSYYLDNSPDLVTLGINPLVHFVEHGCREGRRPNPAFDPRWYLEMNPDVAASGQNTLEHFVRFGWREGRDPSPEFSTADYLAAHPDIAARGINPLEHYMVHGVREGRAIAPSQASARRLPAPKRVMLRVSGTAQPGASATPPTVVCLSHVMPWPPHAGNEYRVLRMLEWMVAEGYRVVLLVAPLTTEAISDQRVDALVSRIGNVVVCGRDGRVRYALQSCPDIFEELDGHSTLNYAHLLAERSHQAPREQELLRIERTFCHDALIKVALHVIERLPRTVLLAEYIWMTRLLPLVAGRARSMVDTHDVYSTKADKVLSFGVTDWALSDNEEAERLEKADLVLAIQDGERAVMARLVPSTEVITVGVDFDLPQTPPPPADAKAILIVGSGNDINRMGIRDFLRFAWPSILARVPDARLIVAGRVGDAVEPGAPNVEVAGVVEDLAPLYARARLVINPAAAGTGLKIKTIEALSHGRAVVTWPNGFDGIPDAICRPMRPPGDWLEFAEQVVAQLQSDTLGLDADTQAAIRAFVSPSHTYAALKERLAQFFAETARPS